MALYLGGKLIAGSIATTVNPAGGPEVPVYVGLDYQVHAGAVPLYPKAKNIRIAGTDGSGQIVERASKANTLLYVDSSRNVAALDLLTYNYVAIDGSKKLICKPLPPANATALGTNGSGNFIKATNVATKPPSGAVCLGTNSDGSWHNVHLYYGYNSDRKTNPNTMGAWTHIHRVPGNVTNKGYAPLLGMSSWELVAKDFTWPATVLGSNDDGDIINRTSDVQNMINTAVAGVGSSHVHGGVGNRLDIIPYCEQVKWQDWFTYNPPAGAAYASQVKWTGVPTTVWCKRYTATEANSGGKASTLWTAYLGDATSPWSSGPAMLQIELCYYTSDLYVYLNPWSTYKTYIEGWADVGVANPSTVRIGHPHPDPDGRSTFSAFFPIRVGGSAAPPPGRSDLVQQGQALQWWTQGHSLPAHIHLSIYW